MSRKKPFTVDDAYQLETPADSVRLYGQWAETYDADFVTRLGYVAPVHITDILTSQTPPIDGPVLDVGCGTGVIGLALRERGIDVVDGIDISQPMLDVAAGKRTAGGDPVYRNLLAADLTAGLDIANDQYAALVSAGTFTHGHLGPGSLDELWRIARPGARCAIGVRTTHFDNAKFADKLATDVINGIISKPELVEIGMYSQVSGSSAHADDRAYVVLCRVT